MKAILVASYLASKGGVARVVWEFAEYLASQGDEVTIVSLFIDRTIYETKEKIKIIDLADKESLPQTMKFWLNLKKTETAFHDLVNKEKPDIVLFNDFPATLWVRKYDSKIPILCYTHDIHMLYTDTYINNLPILTRTIWRVLRLFIRSYDRKKWKYFDEVICNSKFLAKYILQTYRRDTRVVYPGTNTGIFSPANDVVKEKAILTMADIKLRKADFLIKASSVLTKKRNDFKIWIVGNKGEYETELKNLVSKHGLGDMVVFFGKVSDKQLADLYSKSLVVLHSVKEAPFGLIVAEAMACGTPVISWYPGGPEEIIVNGESGFLIAENDQDSLNNHIEKFLDSPKLSVHMGTKARQRILENFELIKQYEKLRMIMSEWISKKPNDSQNKHTNFSVDENISLQDKWFGDFRHKLHLVLGIIKYVKTFSNFYVVIQCYRKNNFPVTGILRNGKQIILHNQMYASLVAFTQTDIKIENNFVHLHAMNHDVMLSGWENNTGVSELFVQDCYNALDVKGKTVVDIGANIGDSAIYFVLKGAKKVIGYEPSLLNYKHALENVSKNGMDSQITVTQSAVGKTEGDMIIDSNAGGSGYRLSDVKGGQEKVHVTTLAKVCENIKDDNLVLKMDCESCEYDIILNSDENTLRRFEKIYLEYHYGYKNLKKKLENLGFEVKIIKPPMSVNPMHHYYLGELMASRK